MKGTANTNNYKPHFHIEIKSLKADLYIKNSSRLQDEAQAESFSLHVLYFQQLLTWLL